MLFPMVKQLGKGFERIASRPRSLHKPWSEEGFMLRPPNGKNIMATKGEPEGADLKTGIIALGSDDMVERSSRAAQVHDKKPA
jgi:hypothetical protein